MQSITPFERQALGWANGEEWYPSFQGVSDIKQQIDDEIKKQTPDYQRIYWFKIDIGQKYELINDFENAEIAYKDAISYAINYLPNISPLVALAILGRHYYARNNYDDALTFFEKVVGILESKYLEKSYVDEKTKKSDLIAEYDYFIGNIYLQKNDVARAIRCFENALKIHLEFFPDGSSNGTIPNKYGLGVSYFRQGDYIRGRRRLIEVSEYYIKKEKGNKDGYLDATDAEILMVTSDALGKIMSLVDDKSAITFFEYCYDFYKINFGDENPKTIDVKESLNNAKEQLSDGPKKSLSIKNEFGGLVELRLVKWAYFLDLAHKLGWEPEGTKPSNEWRTPESWDMFDYYGGAGQIISVTDASMLGEALSRAYRIGWPENENANFDVFEFEEERNFLGMFSRFCLDGGSLHLF